MADPRHGSVGTYAADLWDKFPEVIAKLTRAKASIKELQGFFKNQAELEQKFAQFYTKTAFTTKDMGEFEAPIGALKDFMKAMAAQHTQNFNQLNQQLLKELEDMRKQLSTSIKAAIKQEEKLRKDLKNAQSAMQSAREKEIAEKKNYEQLQAKLASSTDLIPKQQQKLQNQVHAAQKASEAAEKNYKAAVAKQKVVRNDYYQKLALLMASLEQLDRKRIKVVSQIMQKYCFLHEGFWQSTEKGVEKMKAVNIVIDEEKDIQTFIAANKTGKQPPPPEEFVPYVVQVPEGLGPKIGSFSSGGSSGVSDSFRVSSSSSDSKKAAAPGTVLKTVKANYDYTPEDPQNELTLHEGDIIDVLEMDDESGWWMGRIKSSTKDPSSVDKKGYFPNNFTSDLSAKPEEEEEENPQQKSKEKLVVTALYAFQGEEGELSFKEGDKITVISKGEDGWWEGELNGVKALFPSNYTSAGKE